MCDGSDKQVADRYIRKPRMEKEVGKRGKHKKIIIIIWRTKKKKKKSLFGVMNNIYRSPDVCVAPMAAAAVLIRAPIKFKKKSKKKKKIDEPSASNILARLYPIVITPHPSHLTLLLYRAAVSLS